MRNLAILATVAALALAGCGNGSSDEASADQVAADDQAAAAEDVLHEQVAAEEAAVSVDMEKTDTLSYNYGKCLVVNQNDASNMYAAIKSGRIANDPDSRAAYEFTRRRAAYWGYKSMKISNEYNDKEKWESLSNKFLNDEVMPIINDVDALTALFKPLRNECSVSAEDFYSFTQDFRENYSDPADNDPIGTLATELKQPALN